MSERSAMPIRQALRLWAAMALATSPRLRLLRRLVPGVAGRANCPAPTFVSDVERVAEFQATALEMSRKAALAERRAEEAEAETERVLAEIQALPITCIDGVNYVSRRDIVALRGGGGS